MNQQDKIYVAGHRGLVGSAIVRKLREKGYEHIITRTHSELELKDAHAVETFFETEKPDYVFLAAAKVGGIMANNTYRADFIFENMQIQNNVIHQAYISKVKKLIFLGSSCIYPKDCPQPIREEYLLTDILEYTNEPYAIAKIAGIKMCESYNIQYKTNFISAMPTNLYGPNDNYHLENSHVLPAMIRKMHLAKCLDENNMDGLRKDLDARPVEGIDGSASKEKIRGILSEYGIDQTQKGNQQITSLTLWGTGNPFREFLHSDDMADACVYLMEHINFTDIIKEISHEEIRNTHINIGTGEDLSINELAHLISGITGFEGSLCWDTKKPDGTFRKLLNVDKLHRLGWKENISLKEGIEKVYHNYLKYTN
jgi:GDP-L-fucose synthase